MPYSDIRHSVLALCQATVDRVVEEHELAWANVMTLDPVKRRLIFLAGAHDTTRLIRKKVIHCDQSFAGLAVDERRSKWIEDVSIPLGSRRFYHKFLIDRFGLRQLCTYPVLNTCNKHQVLLIFNLFPKQLFTALDRKTTERVWAKNIREFGEDFERYLGEGCHRAVNRLNATIGAQQERATLKSLCRLFARVTKDRLACDFVAVFTQRPQYERIELQGWADDVRPLRDYFGEIESLAQSVWQRNREELHLVDIDGGYADDRTPQTIARNGGSLMLVPIRTAKGTAAGVVVAVNFSGGAKQEPVPFTYEQVAIVEALGQATLPRIELMYSEERKSMAMSRLAHEMRVPVSAFRAALEVINEEMKENGWSFKRPYQDDLANYAQIMQWNVRDLDLVRGAIDRIQLNTNSMVLVEKDVIQPAKRFVEPECKRRLFHSEKIHIQSFQGIFPALQIDRDIMTQVVFNLLENAIKYAVPDRPDLFQVEITPFKDKQGRYCIRFVDNGTGVPAGYEEKIFQESYRHIDVWHIPGDGLGLFVSRQLVSLHGGSLECVPRAKGAEFVLSLPALLERKDRPSS